jgi:hypothetical protein
MSAYHSFCPLYSSARLGLGLGGDCAVPRPAGRFCLATPLPIFAISEGTVPNARGRTIGAHNSGFWKRKSFSRFTQ